MNHPKNAYFIPGLRGIQIGLIQIDRSQLMVDQWQLIRNNAIWNLIFCKVKWDSNVCGNSEKKANAIRIECWSISHIENEFLALTLIWPSNTFAVESNHIWRDWCWSQTENVLFLTFQRMTFNNHLQKSRIKFNDIVKANQLIMLSRLNI